MPGCRGSIHGEQTRLTKVAGRVAERLRLAVAKVDARHQAATEKLQARFAAREARVRARPTETPAQRAQVQQRLARLRADLRAALAKHKRARAEALRRLPRQIECAALSRRNARAIVAASCGASCHLGLPSGIGGNETLVTLQTGRGSLRALPARFVVTSASSLVPSHDAQSFEPRTDYPVAVQERRYDADLGERAKVVDIAQNMQPGLIANSNVGAVDGTPVVVNGAGVVLGGNGRTMGAQRHYASGRRVLAEYLERHAAQFGLTPDQVAKFKDPIVVRVVDAPRADWPRLVRDLNVGLTQTMDATTEAVAQARHLPADTLATLASGLQDSDLKTFLTTRASLPLVGALERSGFLNRANRGRFLTKDGLLSKDAHAQLERQLVAALVPDAAVLERLPAGLRGALTRSAPFWLGAAAAGPGWNVPAVLMPALRDLLALQASGQCMAQWDRQVSMVPRETLDGTLARTVMQVLDLAGDRPVVLTRIARAFFEASARGGLFGPSDPLPALQAAAQEFGVNPASAASHRRCKK